MRLPVPEGVAFMVGLELLEMKERSAATVMALQLDVYLPQETGEKTKTGQTDDSMLVGDKSNGYLKDVLRAAYDKDRDQDELVFPDLTLARYGALVRSASKRLGLEASAPWQRDQLLPRRRLP